MLMRGDPRRQGSAGCASRWSRVCWPGRVSRSIIWH